MMNAEPFNYEKHAEMVKRWAGTHQFALPPAHLLPNIGFMVNDTACGFLYTSNSAMGWCEWVFSNPDKPKAERTEALDILFQLIEAAAKEFKMQILFSAAAIPAYAEVLERNGYEKTDKNVTHFIKKIGSDAWPL